MTSKPTKTAGIDRSHKASYAEKAVFFALHSMIIAFCVWLVLYNGLESLDQGFGQNLGQGEGRTGGFADPTRAYILLFCAVLYWLRHAITLFYLLERRVEWGEVFGLTIFIAVIDVGLILIGGGAFRDHEIGLGLLDLGAAFLLLFGSYLNSASELQRKWWKQDPAHKGRSYGEGLFAYSMHINYFGDVVLFSGWCLFTATLWTFILPVFMAFSFIFYHIPGLDAHLEEKYGDEFRAYAKRTSKLIPFIY